MIVDTSALVAIAAGEPEAHRMMVAMNSATNRWIGSITVVELHMVMTRIWGPASGGAVERLLAELHVKSIPFGSKHASVARAAFDRFGKGRHAASLNLGDCCAYAIAMVAGLPLLFKGEDFSRTDVRVVRY